MSRVYSFQERAAWEGGAVSEAAWEDLYRQIWPDYLTSMRVPSERCALQTQGVDRIVYLKSGPAFRIDEKIRSTDYRDVLLEEFSRCEFDPERRLVTRWHQIGWALDDGKVCDYVVYAIPLLGVAYLLPFDELRRACHANFERWKQNPRWYPKATRSQGSGGHYWWTVSAAIPFEELNRCMSGQRCAWLSTNLRSA